MSDIIQCITEPECWDFLNEWRKKPMTDAPREDLKESDLKWEYLYDTFPSLRLTQGETIFRVHHGGCDEPEFADYEGYRENQRELFNEAHDKWEGEQDRSSIRFDRHWVSFTKDPQVIRSPYFQSKGMRGFVIVASANKAVDISELPALGFIQDEQEVVAPLDKAQVVEILPFAKFKEQYCKSKSEE
ncbi:hypothetical protein [Bifidobacterium mongoliense]|uniref:hypothetical protein n=1 Tax=Bifidobacterium mongoliense TaxID=518643 RepID=UPI0030ECEA63